MKLINARQVWTESQHESNASISAVAIDKAESAPVKTGNRMRRHEAVFAALGEDKEERIQIVRQKISISEPRTWPPSARSCAPSTRFRSRCSSSGTTSTTRQ
jgi:hypothetical protein